MGKKTILMKPVISSDPKIHFVFYWSSALVQWYV